MKNKYKHGMLSAFLMTVFVDFCKMARAILGQPPMSFYFEVGVSFIAMVFFYYVLSPDKE